MSPKSFKILVVIQECRESPSAGLCSLWEGHAPVVQLLVWNLPTRNFFRQPWNTELLELSHWLVCCSSLVSRAATWYFMHTDNHIITANRVKETSIAQCCRVRTFPNSLSYPRSKKGCSCLLTEVYGNDFFTDRQCMKSFSTLSAFPHFPQIYPDDGESDVFFNFTSYLSP